MFKVTNCHLKELIKDCKVECEIKSIEQAQELFESIGYYKLIELNDHMTVYKNEFISFATQEVNNKHIYIEFEDDGFYSSIDEMKEEILKYNIPIKNNDFFAKKALTELKEVYKKVE